MTGKALGTLFMGPEHLFYQLWVWVRQSLASAILETHKWQWTLKEDGVFVKPKNSLIWPE